MRRTNDPSRRWWGVVVAASPFGPVAASPAQEAPPDGTWTADAEVRVEHTVTDPASGPRRGSSPATARFMRTATSASPPRASA